MTGPAPLGIVIETEVAHGRLILRDFTPSGPGDCFASRTLDYREAGETLHLATEARVYEEILIRTEYDQRTGVVAAVLRREEAEVTVTGRVEGWTPP